LVSCSILAESWVISRSWAVWVWFMSCCRSGWRELVTSGAGVYRRTVCLNWGVG
jgi:hypothetical protein